MANNLNNFVVEDNCRSCNNILLWNRLIHLLIHEYKESVMEYNANSQLL